MNIAAVVEVSRGPEGKVETQMIARAVRAAQRGLVVFLLNDVDACEMDAILDPYIKPPFPSPGFLYCRDRRELEEATRSGRRDLGSRH